mmetsp:Transcript_121123/g.222775  ORF Transcript_121123/g.222775 Transcript_121123/m.222775 type:complete len:83 (-) Transcript_121123:18-266(-)
MTIGTATRSKDLHIVHSNHAQSNDRKPFVLIPPNFQTNSTPVSSLFITRDKQDGKLGPPHSATGASIGGMDLKPRRVRAGEF